MFSQYFKCTFLSDIVLNPTSATEGSFKSLDYISGSNFLGIVASDKNYENFGNNTYDIFHSGKVRFNDAHIAMNNKRSLKQPAAWFYRKEEKDKPDKKIYLHHLFNKSQLVQMIKDGKQLKQVRTGYFVYDENELKIPKITHNFSIKSAHNIEERRSDDRKMYGYDVLKAGSEWIFSVESDKESLLDDITKYLEGEKHIGRSKTAQYGRVKIEKLDNFDQIDFTDYGYKKNLILYFESSAAFFDKYGLPTFQPEIKDLRLESGKINWEKSQILTKSFAPWNGTRKTRDADRVCIDKGSVIVVEGIPDNFDVKAYKNKKLIEMGIGIYKNEGFGKVLVNPKFLTNSKGDAILDFSFVKSDSADKQNNLLSAIVKNDDSDEIILSYVEIKKTKQENLKKILKATNKFVEEYEKKFKHISSSQWGAIREIAQRNTKNNDIISELFRPKEAKGKDDEGGFLRHGKSEKQWKNLWKTLKKEIEEVKEIIEVKEENDKQLFACKFLINLCGEMAKLGGEK